MPYILQVFMQNILSDITNNVEKVIIGKRDSVKLALIALVCNGHVLIEDVPGVGKTSLVSAIAKSVSASFKRIQFTPDIMPSDITGFSMYNQKNGEFEFKQGSIMSQIILADEINRTSPKTQASLLEVMEEHQVTVDGVTYPVPRPFMVLATQNPVDYLGTYPLPEAQLDRFLIKLNIGYPEQRDEVSMLERFSLESPMDKLAPVATSGDILALQDNVKQVHVERSLSEYIVRIVTSTRANRDVLLGASPRGSLSLYRAAQGLALYNGRAFVLPEDIKSMAAPVLTHRLILKQEAKLNRVKPENIIDQILDSIPVPIYHDGKTK